MTVMMVVSNISKVFINWFYWNEEGGKQENQQDDIRKGEVYGQAVRHPG
jgi:hypothetical protein